MANEVPYGILFHLLYISVQAGNYRKKNNHIVPEALSISLVMVTGNLSLMGKIFHACKAEELKGTENCDSIITVEKNYQLKIKSIKKVY
jgi:hypothetical protein